LQNCSKILEPVSLFESKQDIEVESVQEDFEINIKSLTFANAREANNAPYPRRLMQVGVGSEANVFNEADFLTSKMPPSSESTDYQLGIGDQLLFSQLNKFVTPTTQLPTQSINADYLIGVGDELTLIQLNEGVNNLSSGISSIPRASDDSDNENTGKLQSNESVLRTSGIVGTDGNILLLGLGSIKAENQSLNDIQTEIRNILIRNGLAPSFQIEITGFNSKKAFITFPNPKKIFGKNIVSITNIPITLKELIINYGVRPSSQDTTIVTLTRDDRVYRMTSGQLFRKSSPRIFIQDRDQIEIEQTLKEFSSNELVVGSRGNILIPNLGSIKAENRSLKDLQAKLRDILIGNGLAPSFQLEITGYNSKSFFLMTKEFGAKAIALDSFELSLKDAVLSNIFNSDSAVVDHKTDKLTLIELRRNNLSYQITLQSMLNGSASKFFIQDGDVIEIKNLTYKNGEVFALGGAGNAEMVPINPSKRETLADILFAPNGALNNLLAKRSEVYLLRGQNPSIAYHLDAQNVSRVLVAAQTELRPNDIVYVADRPIISFSRTLAELLPLRTLLRDIQNNDIP
jgi:protein involved in polysaccharide export with SLBB domain